MPITPDQIAAAVAQVRQAPYYHPGFGEPAEGELMSARTASSRMMSELDSAFVAIPEADVSDWMSEWRLQPAHRHLDERDGPVSAAEFRRIAADAATWARNYLASLGKANALDELDAIQATIEQELKAHAANVEHLREQYHAVHSAITEGEDLGLAVVLSSGGVRLLSDKYEAEVDANSPQMLSPFARRGLDVLRRCASDFHSFDKLGFDVRVTGVVLLKDPTRIGVRGWLIDRRLGKSAADKKTGRAFRHGDKVQAG